MKTGLCASLAAILLLSAGIAYASPSYYCCRTDKPIVIDGKMDEQSWKAVPSLLVFGDLAMGTAPAYRTVAKMLWDDQNLYVGFEMEDTNVWSVVDDLQGPGAKRAIMNHDLFVKVFLDPDADGQNYIELHVNPLNNLYQTCLGAGSKDRFKRDLDLSPANYHNGWVCGGLKRAVHVDGTLNKPDDVDRGWSVEMAIPWSSLKRFCKGSCPPSAGDVWRAHLGRVHRKEPGAQRIYWTWPVIGIEDCHQPDKWGYLMFSDAPAVCRAAPPSPAPGAEQYALKLAWVWSLEKQPAAEIAGLARSLGFNALAWMLPDRTNLAEECHKAGVKVFGVVFFPSDPEDKKFAQVVLPDEEKWAKKLQEGPLKELGQGGGEPVIGGETAIMDFWCPDRPETMDYAKRRIDRFIAAGYDGIAFDGIGYKNFYACFCPVSIARHDEFAKAHPELSRQAAVFKYSEQCLVEFSSTLVKYVREQKPGITTTCHIWPDFAPDPLYGNKIPFDFCGQTVSWFYQPLWADDKVERYIHEVVANGGRYHSGSQGAPFLGLWYPPGKRPPEKVREFLRLVKKSGAKGLQLCELSSILSDPAVAQVVSEELGGSYRKK